MIFYSIDQALQIAGGDRPSGTCNAQSGEDLLAFEGLTPSIAFDHEWRRHDRSLHGGEAPSTLLALSPPANAFFLPCCVNDPSPLATAIRTLHGIVLP
jgi:hypothetical protein